MSGTDELTALKERQRAMWATGDFPSIARMISEVGETCVEAAGIEPGMEVLDVACGAGNAAIPAAQRGARVTGLDLTPELLEAGREQAAEAGVEVAWVEGDAEALPFGDASFDRVISTFGVMFAPRHDVAAAELVRVCRPGGQIVMCNWTPDGAVGQLFAAMAKYVPPPPGGKPPVLWGTAGHLRELFSGAGEPRLEPRVVRIPRDPVDYMAYFEENFGPMILAKAALEPEGRWADLRAEIVEVGHRFTRDGAIEQAYVVVTVPR